MNLKITLDKTLDPAAYAFAGVESCVLFSQVLSVSIGEYIKSFTLVHCALTTEESSSYPDMASVSVDIKTGQARLYCEWSKEGSYADIPVKVVLADAFPHV